MSQSSATEARRGKKRRRGPSVAVPVIFILLGILVLLYPIGAMQFNSFHQTQFANEYNQQVQALSPVQVSKAVEAARAYNASLKATTIKDPWTDADHSQEAQAAYLSQLHDFDAMSRVRVPSLGIDLPVYHGTSDATLARGVGHLYGSSLPVGGMNTHAVMTTHSAWANAKLFDRLPEIKKGDLIFIDTYGETLTYQVENTEVVLPNQLDALGPVQGKDMLTLFTCTPRAINTHRLLVHALRIPNPPQAAPETNVLKSMDWSIQPWMYSRLGGSALGLLLIAFLLISAARRRHSNKPGAPRRQEAS